MKILKRIGAILVILFSFALEFLHAQVLPPVWTFPTNLDSWSFPDLSNWPSDNGYAPVSFTNISSVQCGDISTKYALVVDKTNDFQARLQYNVIEANGATNLTLGLGTITFWFAPGSWASASIGGTGPGAWAELLSVGQWRTNASYGYWGLSLDAAGTNIYFASQNSTGSNATYLSEPITWSTNEWHFLALSYSVTNTAFYLDGKLATTGPGLTILPGTSAVTNGFFIGSDSAGFAQARGVFDDIYTFGRPLSDIDVENIYDSQYYDFFLNPYNSSDYFYDNADPWLGSGSNLWVNIASISNNLATVLVGHTSPDALYEIQGKTNLLQPNWISEAFVYGSELTNWTPANVMASMAGDLFLRTRSWQDSTGTGIPDWWWLQYYGQITNVDAYASAAGDGYNNLQKFQMGLSPTNYYNTNAPSGFFGAVMQATNVFLLWNPSPGPVANYLVRRGVFNDDTGDYTYASFALSSNVTLFEDIGAVTNNNTQDNKYTLQAVYIDGTTTGPDIWSPWQFSYYGAPPYAPPMATNVWANSDSTGTNLLISWTPAQGPLTNYIIERGIYNETNFNYDYYPLVVVSTNTHFIEIFNEFTNSVNWNNVYAVVATYAGGVLSKPAISTIEAGSAGGAAAPKGFFGYLDSTGTNAWFAWNLSTNATGYIIYRGVYNLSVAPFAYGYIPITSIGAGTNNFERIGLDTSGNDVYTVVAVYAGGVLSQPATPWRVSNGAAAPAMLYAYLDSTGTNVILAWSSDARGATGYIVSRSCDDGSSYSQVAQVSSNMFTFEHTNGAPSGVSSLVYEIYATYPHGGVSTPVAATVGITPPPPTGLSAIVDSTGTNVILSWQAALGSVSSYTIERVIFDPTTGTYAYTQIGTAAGTTFEDFGGFSGGNDNNNFYEVLANHAGGQTSLPTTSHVKVTLTPSHSNLNISAQLIRNELGRWQLMFSAIPTNVVTIIFSWYEFDNWEDVFGGPYDPGQPFDAGTYIPVIDITNDVYPLSDAMMTNWFGNNGFTKVAMVQALGADGSYGNLSEAGYESYDSPVFVDARVHMKQNLIYELRAATLTQPNVSLSEEYGYGGGNSYGSFGVSSSNTDYVESSLFHWSVMSRGVGNASEYVKMDNMWPIVANYELHTDLYDTNDTGDSVFQWQPQGGPETLTFQGSLTNNPAPPVLGIGEPYWISQPIGLYGGLSYDPTTGEPVEIPYGVFSDLPLDYDGVNLYYGSGAKNLFGLAFDIALVHDTDPLAVVDPGSSTGVTNVNSFYSQVVDPVLVLTNYYFAPVITPGTAQPIGEPLIEPYPLPCLSAFSNTNQTRIMIASVGTPFVIGGWERFAISNGSPSKFAYLGQYFDTNIFLLSNGIPVIGSPGVISPYGEFFAIKPGAVVLSTVPDIDTEDVGIAVVHVVSLNVDANHDGIMDSSYQGPDFVSDSKPFRFWVNDNQDVGDDTGDGIPGKGAQGDGMLQVQIPNNSPFIPYSFSPTSMKAWTVHGRRDLVDFFPVCVNIGSLFQSNALNASISVTDTNYQFILSQADGVLRFAYTDLTPTNYINFLRDTNESGVLANAFLTTITNVINGGVPLSPLFITGIATNNQEIILVEAAAPTTQPLVLTIYHGTNQIAQAQLPLSITGVEQMFRQKDLVSEVFPDSGIHGIPADRLTDSSVPNEPDTNDRNFVFVHGYNVDPAHARGNASDIYKKLYWAGSHAKFYAVTWHGAESQVGGVLTPNYHTNVCNAFLTAPHLADFLATLDGSTTLAGHSLGNMVSLSAINDWGAHPDNYFMIDAAVATEAIDGTTSPILQMANSTWVTPEDYSTKLYAACWANLFSSGDARHTLTWSNRLANLGSVEVYNFYSSGEEILREYNDDPPFSAFGSASLLRTYWNLHPPLGSCAWVWQEKGKGVGPVDTVLGSTHGGWKLNTSYDTNNNPLSATLANALSTSQLQTNAFFDLTSLLFGNVDLNLYGSFGSSYASTYGNRILADAIPVLSWPVGSHSVPALDQPTQQHNFDMQTTYENGWPADRTGTEVLNWHHSDFRQVAYTFTYQLFDEWVQLGNLK